MIHNAWKVGRCAFVAAWLFAGMGLIARGESSLTEGGKRTEVNCVAAEQQIQTNQGTLAITPTTTDQGVASTGAATTVSPSSAAGREALGSVNRLLDAIGKGDDELFRSQIIPEGTATIFRDAQFRTMCLGDLAARIKRLTSGPDHLEEHIEHPLIHIDDNIAVIWSPYQALRNGRLDHCGTNIFSLVRRDGQWMIAGIVDNYRTDCAGEAKN